MLGVIKMINYNLPTNKKIQIAQNVSIQHSSFTIPYYTIIKKLMLLLNSIITNFPLCTLLFHNQILFWNCFLLDAPFKFKANNCCCNFCSLLVNFLFYASFFKILSFKIVHCFDHISEQVKTGKL